MTTQTAARDIISGLVNAAWLADALSAGIVLLWADVIGDKPPAHDARGNAVPFARVAVRHFFGEQDTLSRVGTRRYLTGGMVQMQIFTPIGDGYALGDQLAEIVKRAFRVQPTTSQVWFFDITPTDLGTDGPWYFQSVEAKFRYQEIA